MSREHEFVCYAIWVYPPPPHHTPERRPISDIVPGGPGCVHHPGQGAASNPASEKRQVVPWQRCHIRPQAAAQGLRNKHGCRSCSQTAATAGHCACINIGREWLVLHDGITPMRTQCEVGMMSGILVRRRTQDLRTGFYSGLSGSSYGFLIKICIWHWTRDLRMALNTGSA